MIGPISQNLPRVSQNDSEDSFKILNSKALNKRIGDICNNCLSNSSNIQSCGCDGDCSCDMEDDCSCDTNEGCGNEGYVG